MALHHSSTSVGIALSADTAEIRSSSSRSRRDDDPSSPSKNQTLDTFSSPASTPLTISFDSAPFLTLAEQSFTPLSIVDDSYDAPDNAGIDNGGGVSGTGGKVGGGKPTDVMGQSTAPSTAPSTALQRIPLGADSACALDPASAVSTRASSGAAGLAGFSGFALAGAGSETYVAGAAGAIAADRQQQSQNPQQGLGGLSHRLSRGRYRNKFQQNTQYTQNTQNTTADSASAAATARDHNKHEEDPAARAVPYDLVDRVGPAGPAGPAGPVGPQLGGPGQGRYSATRSVADTASSSPKLALHGHAVHAGLGLNAHDTLSSSPQSIDDFPPPLRTGSVQLDTQLAQPRPKPIVRTASDSGSLAIKHPTPDLNVRSGAYLGNIAQLEATAERLSLTSSIEDAIRDLHCELKRSDSRRSSLLAARRANSADDNNSATPASAVGQLKRHLSTSSSIVSTNIAARHGGYSPAGYVMSPSHSLTGRLRSGSKNSSGRPELDFPSSLSRHGPGKASVRSVRSTKLSLAEISEMEPVTLTQDVLDKADAQSPIKNDEHDSLLPPELKDANMPSTEMFRNMMGDDDFLGPNGRSSSGMADPSSHLLAHEEEPQRPGSSGSVNTFQQCQDAFGDFDGVHWEPEHDEDPYAPPPEPELPPPPPRMPISSLPPRPQSYLDPESGQQMNFYPARVPAMLNLPPKLSNKPKASERINRRSQVLSAMMDGNRQSRMLGTKGSVPENARDSWLPDPLAGHRESFAALSSEQLGHSSETKSVHTDEQPAVAQAQPEVVKVEAEPLRRPRRLSKMDPDKRTSRMARLDNLPPQLRASAYFDIPPTAPPEIEVKDGSAMATLESILDASAHAPVSAFTDHSYAGKLGNEVYGKEKKRVSMAPSAILRPSSEGKDNPAKDNPVKGHHKRGSSFLWLGRRHSHANLKQDERDSDSDDGQLGPVNADTRAREDDALAGSDTSSSHVIRVGVEPAEDEVVDEYDTEEEGEGADYHGPPTTLLAELQLRKQRQKQRTQNHFPNGMHATLLEMDAVAETERKNRKGKRVNLAWEDGERHLGDEDSEDEDVPLAIIAARNQGAKNVMDLNRPLGLMERRELEDNEPLSQRRARLAGLDPRSLIISKRPSNMNLSATSQGACPLPSPGEPPIEPEEDDEGETLADRKRRLAAKDEAENALPRARPVSSVFSAELLSQFGDPEERKKEEEEKEKAKAAKAVGATGGGEETLGQRRRRLQAEREAREHEMSYNNLQEVPSNAPIPGIYRSRMNMSDVLAAHPRREMDIRAEEERRRIEHENRAARDREAKMAAMRSQMPTSLTTPNVQRSGGYQSGAFNDGLGGGGPEAAKSSPALHAHMFATNYQNRASTIINPYGGPVQNPYASMVNLGAMNNPGYGVGYGGMNTLSPYGGNTMSVYGGAMLQPGMQMPMNGGSMDRVEQWRQGVYP